jgi:DNA (cytosine-5)-methyltransferase 1
MTPTPDQIRQARQKAGLTQGQAGALIGKSWRTWQNWEAPTNARRHRGMDPALWELFNIKIKESKNEK